jgi:hypothetical protein
MHNEEVNQKLEAAEQQVQQLEECLRLGNEAEASRLRERIADADR